jgi:hypothetical protein
MKKYIERGYIPNTLMTDITEAYEEPNPQNNVQS